MSEWREVRLGDVLRVKHGYAFPGASFGDQMAAPQLVTPGNFAIGGGFQESKPKSFSGEVPAEYVLAPGDVVVTMTDLSKKADTLGYSATIPAGRTYLHNQRIGLIEIIDRVRIDQRFLNYYLRTPGYRNYIVATSSGSTVKHTSPGRIESYEGLLPPLREQRAIAEVLGALDDKIEANRKLASTADALAESLYRRVISGLERVPMSQLLEAQLGATPKRSVEDYWGGDRPWVSAKDIANAEGGLVLETDEAITDLAVSQTRARPLPIGSVVLTARGTVGKVARLGVPAAFNQSCYAFVPDGISPALLYLSVRQAGTELMSLVHGSVFDTITTRTFDHVQIPDVRMAPEAATGRLTHLLAHTESKAWESRHLSALRDTLLPKLMSGQLRVEEVAERAGL